MKAAPSYSPTLKSAVPLPQAGLTSEFGMGSGISPPLSAQPNRYFRLIQKPSKLFASKLFVKASLVYLCVYTAVGFSSIFLAFG
jgi:hypothetical protein